PHLARPDVRARPGQPDRVVHERPEGGGVVAAGEQDRGGSGQVAAGEGGRARLGGGAAGGGGGGARPRGGGGGGEARGGGGGAAPVRIDDAEGAARRPHPRVHHREVDGGAGEPGNAGLEEERPGERVVARDLVGQIHEPRVGERGEEHALHLRGEAGARPVVG